MEWRSTNVGLSRAGVGRVAGNQVDRLEIEIRKREIEGRYGPWTAHNLQLHGDLPIIGPGVVGGIEARVTPFPSVRREHRGERYYGCVVPEPPPDTPPLSTDALWASIGNPHSFELTRASLCNALADAGYSSVLECHLPPLREQRTDRVTLAAFARPREPILSVPVLNEQSRERLPEPSVPSGHALRRRRTWGRLGAVVPRPVKQLARRTLRRPTRLP
jgi:hypothetical protein